jgi:RNA polymerase sigma-70 factor (ECF subfamily)
MKRRDPGDANSSQQGDATTQPVSHDAEPPGLESTIDLLRRYRGGDKRALNELLKRNLMPLRRWATGRLPAGARDLRDTEDLVQDTIAKALPKLAEIEYRGEGAVQAYLRQAIANHIRNEYRRANRRPAHFSAKTELVEHGPSPLDQVIGREAVENYERALCGLGDNDKQLVILRLELGYRYQQIADATGRASADAARMATGRAIFRLARAMRGEET